MEVVPEEPEAQAVEEVAEVVLEGSAEGRVPVDRVAGQGQDLPVDRVAGQEWEWGLPVDRAAGQEQDLPAGRSNRPLI